MVSEAEAKNAVASLTAAAEMLTKRGDISLSGLILTGRECIRALWADLHPPPPGEGAPTP